MSWLQLCTKAVWTATRRASMLFVQTAAAAAAARPCQLFECAHVSESVAVVTSLFHALIKHVKAARFAVGALLCTTRRRSEDGA